MGTFGYNCLLGKCDLIPIDVNKNLYPTVFVYGIGFGLPCFLTVVSYSVICWYVWSSGSYLKGTG